MNSELIKKISGYIPIIINVLIIVFAGLFLIKCLIKLFKKFLDKSKIDSTVKIFLLSLIKIFMYAVLIIMVLSAFGIDTGSLLATLSVVGVAVSLAVKDSLSNLAGGVLILFARPFGVGDFIETEDVSGKVDSISILYTKLHTIDNKVIYIPNGRVSVATIVNYSSEDKRRLDLVFGISYESDFNKAKEILGKIVDDCDIALKTPEPIINILEFGNSSVDIAVRVWVLNDEYFDLKFYLNESIKEAFDKENIEIPYNKIDINIKNNN